MTIRAHVTINRRIVFKGVEYHSVDDMPADARAEFVKAIDTQVPAELRSLFDEQHPVDVRRVIEAQGGVPTETRLIVESPLADGNATALRVFLAGLAAAGAFALYFWLRA